MHWYAVYPVDQGRGEPKTREVFELPECVVLSNARWPWRDAHPPIKARC